MTPIPDPPRFGFWGAVWAVLFTLALGACFFGAAWVASKVVGVVVDVVRWIFG